MEFSRRGISRRAPKWRPPVSSQPPRDPSLCLLAHGLTIHQKQKSNIPLPACFIYPLRLCSMWGRNQKTSRRSLWRLSKGCLSWCMRGRGGQSSRKRSTHGRTCSPQPSPGSGCRAQAGNSTESRVGSGGIVDLHSMRVLISFALQFPEWRARDDW